MSWNLSASSARPRIEIVPVDRPWEWLTAGWRDFLQAKSLSFTYGGAIFAVSLLLTTVLFWTDMFFLLLPMLAGFALVAPLMAAGLYEISRRLEAGLPVGFWEGFGGIFRNSAQLGLMGLLLLLLHLAWVRIATLLFALFYGVRDVSLVSLLDFLLTPSMSLAFLILGTIVGAALALVAFVLSCVSIPMLVDRNVSVIEAVKTSIHAVLLNWPAMILWASLIAMAMMVGVVTFYLGFIFLMPLIGYATWHAYRDLVVASDP